MTNVVSGLPNLNALAPGTQRTRSPADRRSGRQLCRRSSRPCPPANERSLVEQIVARLKVGSEVAHASIRATRAFLPGPSRSGTADRPSCRGACLPVPQPGQDRRQAVRLRVSFGVEIGSGRSLDQPPQQRAGRRRRSRRRRAKWKYHDPEHLKDADGGCRCSASSTLRSTTARCGSPISRKLDLRTNRIRGAEALARWTHPEKGPISPAEFIAAAEQNDRIEKLTISSSTRRSKRRRVNQPGAWAIQHGGQPVGTDAGRQDASFRVSRDRSSSHGLEPARLTLELTETAALAGNGAEPARCSACGISASGFRSTTMAPACRRSTI